MMKEKIKEISSKGIKISLVEDGKEIGRCFIYLIKNDLHREPYALLEDVFVKETHRRKGLGTRLVKKAIEKAKEFGCYKIIATGRFEREFAHKFYEKLGFKKWGFEFRIDLR